MCQSLFYGMPEKQRQVFFTYSQQPVQTKCVGDITFNQFFKVRFEGKKEAIYSLSTKLAGGLKSNVYSNFKIYQSWKYAFPAHATKLGFQQYKDNAILEVTMTNSGMGLCDVEQHVQEEIGSTVAGLSTFITRFSKIQTKAN
mmetsp:Transcript_11703/g.17775  ORF Transcript_11703/g.17775 Transcript_11703/m.17775 type:complete len:142 (+) Transcript_11703:3427-3852(+)